MPNYYNEIPDGWIDGTATEISNDEAAMIMPYAFQSCTALTLVSLPAVAYIGSSAFAYCSALTSVYILTSIIPILANTNAFSSTPLSVSTYTGSFGSIFVYSSLLASFKTATNWSIYSDRMVGV